MELSVLTNSFNSYGGSPSFRILEALFELRDRGFGSAINKVEFTLMFKSAGTFEDQKVNRSLRSNFENFHASIDRLEQIKFQRKKGIVDIKAKAQFAHAEEVFPRTKEQYAFRNQTYCRDWNVAALELLLERLRQFRSKIKKSDDFDFDGFLLWAESLVSKIPQEKAQADEMIAEHKVLKDRQRAQLSNWEKLYLDWEDFHPKARDIIPYPSLWSNVDDLAPNGNDTGADILGEIQDNLSHHKKVSNDHKDEFPKVWKSWGFDWPLDLENLDELVADQFRKYSVGYAFGLLKTLGRCPIWLRKLAIKQIVDHQNDLEKTIPGWEHLPDLKKQNEAMLAVLRSGTTPSS